MGSHSYQPDQNHRQSTRLRDWDYASPGVYFITICTYQRENLFEQHTLREIAENAWRAIPSQLHAGHVTLDEWVLMPNHLHAILVLKDRDQATAVASPGTFPPTYQPSRSNQPPRGMEPGSIGIIVGTYKSGVTRRINNLRRMPGGRVWQRGYYDRIVRNERELGAIREYIRDNPVRWDEDRDNLDTLLSKMRWVSSTPDNREIPRP